MQYLILFRAVDSDVLRGTKIANLRIKVMEVNLIGCLLTKSIIYGNIGAND